MSLRDALSKLDDAIEDLSSLHVQTFSGTLSIDVSAEGKFKDLETALAAADAANSEIRLSLETYIRFDGDAYNFVADGATDQLRQIHKDAIDAGINTRKGLMEMVTGWFK